MSDSDAFLADLQTLGFRFVQESRQGTAQLSKQANPYLTYWVHWDPADESVLFTWEFGIGEYMSDHGMQIGANEELNSFLFPKYDARGPQDVSFVVGEIDRTEHILRSVDLLGGTGAPPG